MYEYPVSGSVRFRPEQISAVSDWGPEHFQLDRTNTSRHLVVNFVSGNEIVNK